MSVNRISHGECNVYLERYSQSCIELVAKGGNRTARQKGELQRGRKDVFKAPVISVIETVKMRKLLQMNIDNHLSILYHKANL